MQRERLEHLSIHRKDGTQTYQEHIKMLLKNGSTRRASLASLAPGTTNQRR